MYIHNSKGSKGILAIEKCEEYMQYNWHELSALQLVAVRRSTGNDVSGPLFSPLFSFSIPFFPVATFSHRRSALIQKLI